MPVPADGRAAATHPLGPVGAVAGGDCVLAVDLGGTKCHGVVADGRGVVLSESVRPVRSADAATALSATLADLRTAAAGAGTTPRAAAVGIPALIAPGSGLAVAGSNVRWHGFDVYELLRDRLAEPFDVDNDVNLAAHGELHRGHGRAVTSFVTLSIGTGVGAAVVLGGQVWPGAHNAAGEVGFIPAATGAAGPEGKRIEALIAGPAIARRAAALATGRPGAATAAVPDARAVVAAAAAGEPVAAGLLARVVEETAGLVASLAAVVDPELVVLDGGVGRALAPWLEPLRHHLRDLLPCPPDLAVSTLRPNATVVGAVERALLLLGRAGRHARPGHHSRAGQPQGDSSALDACARP